MSDTLHIKVSIGMPIYNMEPFVMKAVNSILNQTHKNIELIISDNGSTDNSVSLVQDLKKSDSRLIFFTQTINKGSIFNFEFVKEKATGEYFMWAAGDDMWDHTLVEKLLKEAIPSRSLILGTLKHLYNDDPELLLCNFKHSYSYRNISVINRTKYFLESGYEGKANLIYGLGPIEIFKSNSLYGHDGITADIKFVYRVLKKHQVISIADAFFFKRVKGKTPVIQKHHSYFRKIYTVTINSFRPVYLKSYIAEANFVEIAILIACYPFAVYNNFRFILKNNFTYLQ